MSASNLVIYIPDLLQDESIIKQPAIKLLLARALQMPGLSGYFEKNIFDLFNYAEQIELPVAALRGLADELDTSKDYWLCADPVELKADLSGVFFLGNDHLQLTTAHLQQIQQILVPFLAQDNLELFMPTNKHWYIKTKTMPAIKTTLWSQLMQQNIYDHMPVGEQQQRWRQLITEIQMLLHQYADTIPVNSLWFWGVGSLPAAPTVKWQMIISDNALLKGLAKHHDVLYGEIPQNFSEISAQMQQPGDYLWVLPPSMHESLSDFINALSRKQVTSLLVYPGDGKGYFLDKKYLRRWWRR